ncbi:unnamed protein product [Cyclocybe aegerita]|uniref:BRCT domain-containing protein n=1 Tax=Cyclocybe aegerita TaxID=1973307 RepID=A0A8S0VW87_CYCAE|nr:unnamed protein product [Cyclocybe aegerita]
MTEAIFLERRTRSQLTLPDNIIQKLSQRSPLKDARTALRNHTTGAGESETQKLEDDSTDDELLLSPGKNKIDMKSTQRSKRSASPPPQDEYSSHSSSPSTGRELKRARRDPVPENGEKDLANATVVQLTLQLTTLGHARYHSEPNMLINRRSARKRSATTSKKPISTVSEGTPPPPNFSPSVSPKKGRAQSVPLFLSTQDIPRIDFRTIPPSPKRSRSPSRSPSKDREPKLRITSGPFPVAKLFTIQDEAPADVDMGEDASSVVEEREMPLIPVTASEEQFAAVAVQDATSALPTSSMSSIYPQGPAAVPATPASQSLNNLIPMSPLTPLPETPFPPKQLADSELESRRAGTSGWDMPPFEPIAPLAAPQLAPPAAPAPAKSRLPRPSGAPPAARASPKPIMGPAATVTAKKPVKNTANPPVAKTVAPKRDAFATLMKGSREQKDRTEKEKEKGVKAKKTVIAFSSSKSVDLFATMSKGKEKVVDAEAPKVRMKDKMRKKEKTKEPKTVAYVPTSDDEEQEQQERMEAISMPLPVEETVTEPPKPTSAKSLEPVESSPLVVEDAIMGPPEHEESGLTVPHDATMKDVEVEARQEDERSPIVPAAATTDTPVLEPEGMEAIPTPEDGAIAQAEETRTATEQKDEVTEDEQRGTAMEQVPTEPRPPSRSGPSKLPVGKKRQPISVAPANRVTRSVSSKKKDDSQPAPVAAPSPKKAPAPAPVPAKRTASGFIKKTKKPVVEQPPAERPAEAPTEIETEPPAEDDDLPSGSPMRMSSPAKMVSTPNKNTTDTTPTKSRFDKMPTPSPSKIARATSLFSKPAHMSRTWSMDFGNPDKSTSSLSTLSNALEKLRMPPPSRPSTSMGFNRDTPGGDDDDLDKPGRSQDDVTIGRKSLGVARSDSLKKRATVGAGAFKAIGTTGNAVASSSKAGGKGLTQKPLSMFMANKGQSSTRGGTIMRGTGRTGARGGKPLFSVGGGVRRTISKKTSLPMVVGSPVKGGGADTTMRDYEEDEEEDKAPTIAPSASGDDGDVFMAPANTSTGTLLLEDLEVEVTSAKGKEKETALSRSNASRRVSMASHALSQSLSALPPPEPSKPRGVMGPPATPKGVRSTSSSYPSSNKDRGSSSSPSKAEESGTRSSARLAKAVPKVVAQSKGSDGSSGKKAASAPEPAPNPAAEALRVLKDCVIFVDVKTDEGDEAGSLFVEMLEGVGAKVLTRVGQTCTHVVYKNGLMSTVTRYRLLRDPKPFVVGIGWVVECVEQRKHVDETNFLVDLEGVNVAGIHKRRRSMLPKLLSNNLHMPMDDDNTEDGDQSMDGSQTSFTMDDGLAPLERARKRKNLLAAAGRP